MHAVDLSDEIRLARLCDGRPSEHVVRWADDAPRPTPIDWAIKDDLAVRAQRLLEREVGRSLPVRMDLLKRVPTGAGMGGGSSDAAAMLLGLDALFGLALGVPRLRDLSAGIGSDVPFFVDERAPPRPGVVTGLGDLIERVSPSRADVVLVIPPVSVATGPVYRAYDASHCARSAREAEVAALSRSPIDAGSLFNDLEAPAACVEPELEHLRQHVQRVSSIPTRMTGSGSVLFVVCDTGAGHEVRDVLERDQRQTRARVPGIWDQCVVVLTRLV